MADTIQVTPQMLRSTANDIQANMEQAMGIAKGYLANQENVMNPATWSGAGVVASHMTATEITNELNKVLTGGTRLAEGLVQAAALTRRTRRQRFRRCSALATDPDPTRFTPRKGISHVRSNHV